MDTEREFEDFLEEGSEDRKLDEDDCNPGYDWEREDCERLRNGYPEGVYSRAPEVTISALTETGKEESDIPVLNQRSYTGRMVIPSALADTRCADLGVDGVLEKLNAAFGTSHPLDSVMLHLLQSVLPSYIGEQSDFGTAYAYLRGVWYDISDIKNVLHKREMEDRKMRREALEVDGRISEKNMPPRRVWDLFANRVVPYWVAAAQEWGISHAWVEENKRVKVWTPINGNQWPVPIPSDADLNLIRIEMLNAGKPYQLRTTGCAWLDVLCLRQEFQPGEHLQVEEWQLDVPTIGWVYRLYPPTMYYLSGPGRPLSLTPGYFDSDRCWFNRAWTLQEVNKEYGGYVGGSTGDGDLDEMFRGRLKTLGQINFVEDALSEMQKRTSTNPMDRVAGLAYLLCSHYIPTYHAKQSEESAWVALVDAMDYKSQMRLLFMYPEPGNGSKRWRPSWKQAMDTTPISLGGEECMAQAPMFDGRFTEFYGAADTFWVCCINSAYVSGLSDTTNHEEPRQGKLLVEDDTRVPHAFNILAKHKYVIPDGLYTLLGRYTCFGSDCDRHSCIPHLYDLVWVVGQIRQDGKFEKVSILEMECYEATRGLRSLRNVKDDVMVTFC